MTIEQYNQEAKRLEFLFGRDDISEAEYVRKYNALDARYNRENEDDESDYCEPTRGNGNQFGMVDADSTFDRSW